MFGNGRSADSEGSGILLRLQNFLCCLRFDEPSGVVSKATRSDYFEVIANNHSVLSPVNEIPGKCRKEKACVFVRPKSAGGALIPRFSLCSRSGPRMKSDRTPVSLGPVPSIESRPHRPVVRALGSGIIYFSISSRASRRISWLFIC